MAEDGSARKDGTAKSGGGAGLDIVIGWVSKLVRPQWLGAYRFLWALRGRRAVAAAVGGGEGAGAVSGARRGPNRPNTNRHARGRA